MQANTASTDQHPIYQADVFAEDALRNPFPHYRAIRDLGPAVRLLHPDVYAIARFEDVKAALTSPEILISSKGVAFNDIINAKRPDPPAIMRDGESHRSIRKVVMSNLTPAALKQYRGLLKDLAVAQVKGLINTPTFDAVIALAQHLPLKAVTNLVGLPEEGRAKMLDWASASFNSNGPLDTDEEGQSFSSDLALAMEVLDYLQKIDPTTFANGSWTAKLFEAVAEGKLSLSEARGAVSAYVIPSLDTTIFAMGNLLYNLAVNPDQFARLKAEPALIGPAVFEGVRHSATVRWFSRYAISDYQAGDVFIPEGARVMIMYGAANRDERRYVNPDDFDVTRKPFDQLGWGGGPHVCAGLNLARMEMEVMLEALVENVDALEADEPVYSTNRGLYGISELPFRMKASVQ